MIWRWIIIKYLQTRTLWKSSSTEPVIIHFSIIMMIWSSLIFIVLNGTGTEEFEFLYVESGQIICGIGEKQIILSEGDAILSILKYCIGFYASSGGVIPNFVCMPEFIAPENSLVYKNIFYQSFHRICLSSVFRLLNRGRQGLYKL